MAASPTVSTMPANRAGLLGSIPDTSQPLLMRFATGLSSLFRAVTVTAVTAPRGVLVTGPSPPGNALPSPFMPLRHARLFISSFGPTRFAAIPLDRVQFAFVFGNALRPPFSPNHVPLCVAPLDDARLSLFPAAHPLSALVSLRRGALFSFFHGRALFSVLLCQSRRCPSPRGRDALSPLLSHVLRSLFPVIRVPLNVFPVESAIVTGAVRTSGAVWLRLVALPCCAVPRSLSGATSSLTAN